MERMSHLKRGARGSEQNAAASSGAFVPRSEFRAPRYFAAGGGSSSPRSMYPSPQRVRISGGSKPLSTLFRK